MPKYDLREIEYQFEGLPFVDFSLVMSEVLYEMSMAKITPLV